MDVLEIQFLGKKYFLFLLVFIIPSIAISVWLFTISIPVGWVLLGLSVLSPLMFQRAFCSPFVSKGKLTVDDHYIIIESFDKKTDDLIYRFEYQYKDLREISPPLSAKTLNNLLVIVTREGIKQSFNIPGYLNIVLIFKTIEKHIKAFNGKVPDDQKVKIGVW